MIPHVFEIEWTRIKKAAGRTYDWPENGEHVTERKPSIGFLGG